MVDPEMNWLTTNFLTKCLQHEEGKQNVVVTKFSTSPACAPGSNYGSCINRLKVEYKDSKDHGEVHSVSLIIKSELTDSSLKEMFDILRFSEPKFYHEFVPIADQMCDTSFLPKSYFSPIDSTVVLEDLNEQGFAVADRTKHLDFDHCRLYVLAAATFNAVSFAVQKDYPKLIKSIGIETMFCEEYDATKTFKKMIKCGLTCMANKTEKVEKFSKYSELIRKTTDRIWYWASEAHKPSKVLNTLTQSDPWTTNMMFKYDDKGVPCKIKLLDFQALRYGSPVNHFPFFIWSSPTHDVRRHRLDELYRMYIDQFNKQLEELNCKERLTYDHFVEDLQRLSPMAIFLAGVLYPMYSSLDKMDFGVFDEEKYESKDFKNPYEKYYSESYCKNHLPNLLEQLEMTGVFECLQSLLKQENAAETLT